MAASRNVESEEFSEGGWMIKVSYVVVGLS